MAQDSGFWNWPVDVAAAQTKSRSLTIGASVLYILGAMALVAQVVFALPPTFAALGVGLILLGIAASVGVLGKVLVARSRQSLR